VILIGIGGNLASALWGPPQATLKAALAQLGAEGVVVRRASGWYRSAPVPASGQPWFVNAVVSAATGLDADELLTSLQSIEKRFGRIRGKRNAARVLDLDLLDYRGELRRSPNLVLPHPRMHQRRFVLEPLAEIAPEWRHPILGSSAAQLLARLDTEQLIERMLC